jgi:hypothetical protein
VSRCNLRYLTGVSLGVQVIWEFWIKIIVKTDKRMYHGFWELEKMAANTIVGYQSQKDGLKSLKETIHNFSLKQH